MVRVHLQVCFLIAVMLPFNKTAVAGEANRAALSKEALVDAWESNYASIRLMRFSTTLRLTEFKKPAVAVSQLSPLSLMHVQRTVDGNEYYTRISKSVRGFDDESSIQEESFDGVDTREYDGGIKHGLIYAGRSGKYSSWVNDIAVVLRNEAYRPLTADDQYLSGKPVFSIAFRDFKAGGAIRPATTVRPELEDVQGEPCHVLEWTDNQTPPTSVRAWLAHKKGMIAMRFERIYQGELAIATEISKVDQLSHNGIALWYPVEATIRQRAAHVGTRVYVLTVHQYELPGQVAQEDFKITFPTGARIYDKNLQVAYTMGRSDFVDMQKAVAESQNQLITSSETRPSESNLKSAVALETPLAAPTSRDYLVTPRLRIYAIGLLLVSFLIIALYRIRRRGGA